MTPRKRIVSARRPCGLARGLDVATHPSHAGRDLAHTETEPIGPSLPNLVTDHLVKRIATAATSLTSRGAWTTGASLRQASVARWRGGAQPNFLTESARREVQCVLSSIFEDAAS